MKMSGWSWQLNPDKGGGQHTVRWSVREQHNIKILHRPPRNHVYIKSSVKLVAGHSIGRAIKRDTNVYWRDKSLSTSSKALCTVHHATDGSGVGEALQSIRAEHNQSLKQPEQCPFPSPHWGAALPPDGSEWEGRKEGVCKCVCVCTRVCMCAHVTSFYDTALYKQSSLTQAHFHERGL